MKTRRMGGEEKRWEEETEPKRLISCITCRERRAGCNQTLESQSLVTMSQVVGCEVKGTADPGTILPILYEYPAPSQPPYTTSRCINVILQKIANQECLWLKVGFASSVERLRWILGGAIWQFASKVDVERELEGSGPEDNLERREAHRLQIMVADTIRTAPRLD